MGAPIGLRYFYQWFASRITLRSGSRLEFHGATRGIYAFFLALMGISLVDRLAESLVDGSSAGDLVPALFGLIVSVGTLYLSAKVNLEFFKWQCANTRSTSGVTMQCVAPDGGYFWRWLLVAVSFVTIVGWAWAATWALKWLFSHVKAEGRTISFHGSGGQLLWRATVSIIACLPIVTIPWVIAWGYRWFVSQLQVEYARSAIGCRPMYSDVRVAYD